MLTELSTEMLSDGLSEMIAQLKESQLSKGLKASGVSAESLHETTTISGTIITGQILGLSRFRFQQSGRGPNRSGKPSWAMVKAIEAWVAIKGISISPWAIATKIAREGIRVPNPYNPGGVLSDVLNMENAKALITPRIRAAVIKEIKSHLFKI